MRQFFTRGLWLRLFAAAACMVVLGGDGGCAPQATPHAPQEQARLAVTTTQPVGTYRPGDSVTFRVTVTNVGQVTVDSIRVHATLGHDLRETASACTTPFGSANDCSAFDRLAPGATATVDITASVITAQAVTAINTVHVDVASGPRYSVANTVSLDNLRGHGWQAFTPSGHHYVIDVDYPNARITFAGQFTQPTNTSPAFTPTADAATFRLPHGAGWRETPDLLVGTADLGHGIQPFIAGRRFIQTTAALDGRTFNLFQVDTSATGAVTTRLRTAFLGRDTLQLCSDPVPRATAADCPAASLQAYNLSGADGAFAVLDDARIEQYMFRVADDHGTLVLLAATSVGIDFGPGTARFFQVGVSANAGVSAGMFTGGDSLARWGTLALTPSTASLQELLTRPDNAGVAIDGTLVAAASGLSAVTLGDGASRAWLAQDGSLAMVLGQAGTPTEGLLQLFAR